MANKIYTIADLHPGGRLYRPLATSEEEEQNKALEAAKNAIHSLEEMRASHRRISSNLDRIDKKLEESKKELERAESLATKCSFSKVPVVINVIAVALTIFFAATVVTKPVLAMKIFLPSMWILYETLTLTKNYQHILGTNPSIAPRWDKITYLDLTKGTLIAKTVVYIYHQFRK